MRSGGLPCRYGGCAEVFQVLAQSSMEALLAAGARRTAHEVDSHAYHHQQLDATIKPRIVTGRLRRSKER